MTARDADGYEITRTHADGYRAARGVPEWSDKYSHPTRIPEPWEAADDAPEQARETRRAWVALALAAAAFVGLLAVGAALAEGYHNYQPRPRMTLEPGRDGCVAIVQIENRAGVYNATETLDVPGYGPVSIRYETVGGHNPSDDDRIEVVALPDALTADPVEAPIADGATLAVCLIEYLGG